MSLKRNTPSLKGKKKQKKPPYSHLCGQRFVNLCFLGKHEVNWIIVFLWSSAGLLRNQNANVRFSPAALLLSNPQNKTKETMIVILCRLLWCYVIQFSWEKSVRQFPKKKNIFVEILRLLENEATMKIPCGRSIRIFTCHSKCAKSISLSGSCCSHIDWFSIDLLALETRTMNISAWFSLSIRELWPQVKTILYFDCSLLRNIALRYVILHCFSIITGL